MVTGGDTKMRNLPVLWNHAGQGSKKLCEAEIFGENCYDYLLRIIQGNAFSTGLFGRNHFNCGQYINFRR